MKTKLILLTALALVPAFLSAQKPALDHSVYDSWKNVSPLSFHNDGQWGSYTVSPQEGDAALHIINVADGREYIIERASALKFTRDDSKALFKIAPSFQQTREAKIKKKKPEQMPKDSLGVIDLATGKIEKIACVKSIRTGELFGQFATFKSAKKGNDTLYVLNVKNMSIDTLKSVESCTFTREGDRFAYVTKPDKKDSTTVKGIFMYDPYTSSGTAVMTGEKESSFEGAAFSDDGKRLAFLAMPDSVSKAGKKPDLYIYDETGVRIAASHDAAGIPQGWKLSPNRAIRFSKEGNYLTLGTMPVPKEKDTTLVDFEQAKLDIWVWNEDYIQPVQKVNLEREKKRTYLAKVNLDGNGSLIQLADPQVPEMSVGKDNTQDYIVAATDKPYRIARQWDTDSHCDLYRISLVDGSRKMIAKDAAFIRLSPSPDGAWWVMYEEAEGNWYLYDVAADRMTNLTGNLGVCFYDEEDDHPSRPSAYSGCVWSEDSRWFMVRDKYDWWQFDPQGKSTPQMITDGKGREANTTYEYVNPFSIEGNDNSLKRNVSIEGKSLWFTSFNHTTKEYGIAVREYSRKGRFSELKNLTAGPYTYGSLSISEGKKPLLAYTRENFEEGRNLWMSRDLMKSQQQLTDINPQQREYNWGTVELVSWMTEDSIRAEGLLFKPEDFDSSKKYPVMIYFYEKYSDDLYAARVPAPSASTVNIPYFTSNGYICFIPDIYYTTGHPGKSAMRSLMPACDMLCQYPWIDGENMAIQGQSWGGYQVAYIITQTDRFKAAGAGAPVSNMTSAYGGIRWGSGIARTLQYEHGQSRIGDDLWHGFDLYVENSPLFFVPNVTTPVLIMHNDKDGAVPWWQGIEFFNGLRRCGKQAWMVQYNDEEHNLTERRNRKDLSIRLEQFFDHFLKGKPMPVWMSRGIPATLKGIDYGFEYDECQEGRDNCQLEDEPAGRVL